MREAKVNQLRRLYADVPVIHCKGLCQESCGPLLMSRLELRRLAPEDPEPVKDSLACPLLKDGRCTRYERRPLICRLWGVAEGMPCPHGCERDGELTRAEAMALGARAQAISGEKGPPQESLHHPEFLEGLIREGK